MSKQVFPIVAAILTYLHTNNTSWRHSSLRNYKTYRGIFISSGSQLWKQAQVCHKNELF